MFRLRVLGGFALDDSSGASAPVLPKRRAAAVLAVLAVCGELGSTRERLLALLWPESDEPSARHGLRDALHAIRRALGPDCVSSGGRLLRLDSSIVSSDTGSFAEALRSGRPADAVRVYSGPLLAGFHVDDAAEFERWLDGERTRLAREYSEALNQLALAAERGGALDQAAGWWARAVEHDPPNSHLILQQVRVLTAMGDRANAIGVVEAHVRRLREDFELEPDREILATIERIRRGEFPTRQRAVSTSPPLPSASLSQPVGESSSNFERPVLPIEMPQASMDAASRGVSLKRWLPWAAGLAAVLLGGAYSSGRLLQAHVTQTGPRTAVAVLPFRNLSADSSYAYFAGGLHDELLTQLAKVASLRVVGRTSVRGYEETSKPLRQIGQELAVGSIVEASVQVIGNRLRVTVQLLDPVTQADLWTESYDRTLGDAFAVQSDIAQRIVTAVGATLTNAEVGAIAAAPTRVAAAYDFYLQGVEYDRRPGLLRENLLIAQQLYERALVLDSTFALAHAALSQVHFAMYGLRYDRAAARLDQAQREADMALRLAPELPEAHLAVGLTHYLVRGDSRKALDEFNLGLRGAPNDVDLWAWIGRVQRTLGNWDSALEAFDHAGRFDPRDANLFHDVGDTYHYLRRYRQAIESYRHELVLAPDLVQPHLSLAWSYVLWKGELDTLRAVLQTVPLNAEPGAGGDPIGDQRLVVLKWERRPDSLLSLLHVMLPTVDTSVRTTSYRALWAAQAYDLRGDTADARAAYDSSAALLEVLERTYPEDATAHFDHGRAVVALRRRADALHELEWLEQSDLHNENRFDPGWADYRARLLIGLGETDAAFSLMDRLLAGPSLFSIHELRLDPDFDPIRNDPRYRTLLRKYANPGT
jgi:TolB-like protein/DNA-binding SARP family transcriptional activator